MSKKQKYKFNKYVNIYDTETIVYGLAEDGVERMIEDVKFIEVTPDFVHVQLVRADSLSKVGSIVKEY